MKSDTEVVPQVRFFACRHIALLVALLIPSGTLLAQSASPVITTIAGGGSPSGNGDGGPATRASLDAPVGIAVDDSGNVFIAERYTFTVRRINTIGIITRVAGNGQQAFNGDGIAAVSAGMDVRGIAADSAGNLYIADGSNRRVRKVNSSGVVSTIAREGLSFPIRVAVSSTGTVCVLDTNRVWIVEANGALKLLAGTGEYGSAGDGGPAVSAQLFSPSSISFDRAGNLYIVDGNERVRRVDTKGIITTIAGGGPFRIDPVARNYKWSFPQAAVADTRGNVYVAGLNNVVRVVNAAGIADDAAGRLIDGGGIVAGGRFGFAGDGGPAVDALLYEPEGIAIDKQENLYIADTRNNRIRKVTRVPTPRSPAGISAFAPYQMYGVGSYVRHVAVADVTGDGRDDALLTTSTWAPGRVEPDKDMRVWLFIQRPDGTLAPPKGYPFPGDLTEGKTGGGLDTGDLNRDGFKDVVVGNLSGITVFLGTPSGLSQGVSYKSQFGAEPSLSVTLMDVDQDRNLDVITLSAGSNVGLVAYYGNGLGGISRQVFQTRPDGVSWARLRAKDMNSDGYPDLVSGWTGRLEDRYRGGFEIALHNRMSGFGAVNRTLAAQPISWGPQYAVGDFDSDGKKDVITSYEANTPDAAYAQFRQEVNGAFSEVGSWSAYDVPSDLLGADMNGDGRDDLVVLHGGWSSIGYFQQTSAGRLDVEVKYYTVQTGNPNWPALAIGDLNSDGCKDIAMADRNYGLVVLAGQKCTRRVNGSQPVVPGIAASSAAETSPMAARTARGVFRYAAAMTPATSLSNGIQSVRTFVLQRKPYQRSLLLIGGLFLLVAAIGGRAWIRTRR
ncbi:FG-GAP-like repeat-containing protein [Pseudoxanthomonas sp. 22568]|uniref:NHL domain-containing protein n=1 Tax=Pseudoxanthomonas sp. 22568 TaxID=3453945 RepID=UPI003F86C108